MPTAFRLLALLVAPIAILTLAVSCGDSGDEEKATLVFSDPDWTSGQVQTRIAQYIVEMGYGHETDAVFDETLPLFDALRRGDTHIMMEIWLPHQDAWVEAEAAGEVVRMGSRIRDDWQSAFVIPAYMQEDYPDLDSVEDLKDDRFKGLFATAESGGKARLMSCVIGWGCDVWNAEQIAGYGLLDDIHTVHPIDAAALNADLYDAYAKREPWLGYQWQTSEAAVLLNLVRLEEPPYTDECWETTRACAHRPADIFVGVYRDVPDNAPEVVEMLRSWSFGIPEHQSMTRWLVDNEDAHVNDAALWWLNGNEDIWSAWVTSEAAEAIRTALANGDIPDGWPGAS